MDNYMKSINQKLAKLTFINDEDKHDDVNLRKLVANSLKIELEDTDTELSRSKKPIQSIQQLLNKDSLLKLRQEFLVVLRERKSGLNIDQFRAALSKAVEMPLHAEKVEELFFKVDVMKNETVTWEAYSNYLLLEMDQKEKLLRMEKELLGENIQFFKTDGRDSIKSLFIVPSGDFDASDSKGSSKDADSRYFTCSRDGIMNFWSYNFQTKDTYFLHSFIARGTTLSYWVTAAEFIPDARLLVIATTNFNLYLFHHGNNKEFDLNTKIEKFPGTIVCLSYHKEEAPSNTSFLTWGDEYGGIGVIAFHVNPGKTSIGVNSKNNFNKKNRLQEFHFTDLSNNHVMGLEARYIANIHYRYVCQVRYVPKLHGWLTCSKDSCTALYIGDLVPNVPPKNRIYYSVLHGVTVFEYCEKMNFIITGGSDMLIRLWNPMAKNHKLVGVFRGHVSPVTHLMLDLKDNYLVSVGETKDILIFDMVNQACIQKIKQHKLKQLGKKPVTAACMNKKTHTVVIASNMRLAVIEGKEDSNAKRDLITNNVPITSVLYNPLFKQIVTGDWKSQVVVWNAVTGSKVVHYTAHTVREKGKQMEVDIKVMSFDATFRRLVTGHRDGMVKIWNYNVGVLLQELPVPNGFEVTSICCPAGKLFVAGCSNLVLLHVEKKFFQDYVALRPPHPDNITQLAVLPEMYLASASADGTLIIYSLKTHLPQFKFNIANIDAPASVDFYRCMNSVHESQPENTLYDKGASTSKRMMKVITLPHRKGLARNPNIQKQKSQNVSKNGLYYTYCVEALVFLSSRELTPDTAALLTCMHSGKVLAWSMSLYGRCLGEFVAAHTESEMLHAADVTRDDTLLVTGDSLGYIKVWDISHYFNPAVGECCEELDKERSLIWETFPYVVMRRDIARFIQMCPNAKLPMHMKLKCVAPIPGQEKSPHLINSFKSHCGCIVSLKLVQLNDRQMVITTASDMSVRLWSIQGLFIGVLGQKNIWTSPEIIFGSLPNGKKEIEAMEAIGKTHDTKPCENKIMTSSPEWKKEIHEVDPDDPKVKFYNAKTLDIIRCNEKFPNLSVMLERVMSSEARMKALVKEFDLFDSKVESRDTDTTLFSDLSVTMQARFSGSKCQLFNRFGERMMDFLDYMKKKNIMRSDIPSDLKRTGSYTTLYVLETEMNIRNSSRWMKIRHATVWIVNFFRQRKLRDFENFTLEKGDASKVGVFSNNIKDMIEEHLSSAHPVQDKTEAMTHRTEQDKRNLMRPLTPLSSEIFGQFYSQHYTNHRPIEPWKVSEEKSEKVCPHKHLALATFPKSDPASTIKEIFQDLGVQTRSTLEIVTVQAQSRTGGFQPSTESEMILVKNLKKTGWKLMSDGTLARKKVPLNSTKAHSYLPPLLVSEIQVREGVKYKGERCFARKLKSPTSA